MAEKLKYGTSTNFRRLLELDITTNPGTFRMLVKLATCKFGAPTLTGSNCSDLKKDNSLIGPTTRFLT